MKNKLLKYMKNDILFSVMTITAALSTFVAVIMITLNASA